MKLVKEKSSFNFPDFSGNNAIFSKCKKHRLSLWRIWNSEKPYVLFVGLNPSVADKKNNDPTITRFVNFAKFWGYGGILVGNIFSLKTTDPKKLILNQNPLHKFNDCWLKYMASKSNKIIGAWGNYGTYLKRYKYIKFILPNINCIGITNLGQPKHPLYQKKNLLPKEFFYPD